MQNVPYSIWIPFLSAISGGLLVLAGQYFDRQAKMKSEKTTSLREIYAYNRKLEALMKNHYPKLEMAKVHVEYWWYCSNISSSEERKRYHDEHLKSQSFAREVERKIGEPKTDFIGHVRKFQAIIAIDSKIEAQLAMISDLKHRKAKSYDVDADHSKIRFEEVEQDEEELRQAYYINLQYFKEINDYLQNTLNSR